MVGGESLTSALMAEIVYDESYLKSNELLDLVSVRYFIADARKMAPAIKCHGLRVMSRVSAF